MHGPHTHDHAHCGAHAHGATSRRRLAWVLVMSASYMIAEYVGGLWTGSLALLADAGHMLSDVAALALSLFAGWIATRPASSSRTYGYYRAEILAAVVNGAALVAIAFFIVWEAVERFQQPEEVAAPLMMAITLGGLCVNLISLSILHSGRNETLNLKGAWLHVMMDAVGSVAALAAGAAIYFLGWNWMDPAASVAIAVLVVYSAWSLLSESVAVLMEFAPRGIDVDDVRQTIASTAGVIGVHDLHVWTIASGMHALSAHVVVLDPAQNAEILAAIRDRLHASVGIDHITIQIEPADYVERPLGF